MKSVAKITQRDIYLIECNSHTIRILDMALCAFEDSLRKSNKELIIPSAQKSELESLHDEVLRILRDGHA
jgi:hypothetical protein